MIVFVVLAGTIALGAVASATGPNGQRRATASLFRDRGSTGTTSTTPPPPTSTTTTSPTTTTTTTPAGNQSSCGGVGPLGVPGTWTCTFDDEFNGTSLDTNNWVVQQTANSEFTTGDINDAACYVDSPNNVSVSGGTLNLTVRQEAAPFTCSDPSGNFTTDYTAGMVSSSGLFTQTDGVFEVSAKLPATTVQGLQETFWLYPQNLTYGAWPASGEIDYAEFYSEFPNLDIPFIHYDEAASDPNVTADDCTIADPSSFNTYGVEWTPSSITVLYNGNVCLVDHWDPASPLVAPQPFDQPFFLALTQALGVTTNQFEPGTTPLPATTSIDWVRVWS